MTALSTKQDRWTIINQTFRSSFLTFSLVELTRRGAGIIDGLFVSNFLSVNEFWVVTFRYVSLYVVMCRNVRIRCCFSDFCVLLYVVLFSYVSYCVVYIQCTNQYPRHEVYCILSTSKFTACSILHPRV